MENASKALIISGAVLIAIALISMGVYIISSQKGVIDNSKDLSDTLEVQTFNSTFLKYVSSGKRGAEVKQLLTEIQTNNNRNGTHKISVKYGEDTSVSSIQTSIYPGKLYKVSVPDNGYENGYVKNIIIEDNN